MLDIQNVSYSAGKRKLVHGLSFQAKGGELLAILGANGAGKSTLLKLLCRELEPSAGEIFFDGIKLPLFSLEELARKRAVLTQHNTLSMSFLVKELVLMGRYPHFRNKPTDHDWQVVRSAMRETGIAHLSDRAYPTLSGGEQQRVQLARVLTQIYDVPNACLFLDEPTTGLDLLYQQQILTLARDLADRGYCVISILHDLNFASRYAHKILLLQHGQKVAFGTPAQVLTCENIEEAFRLQVKLLPCEGFECPLVIPLGGHDLQWRTSADGNSQPKRVGREEADNRRIQSTGNPNGLPGT
ncbi:heme ABC transporter ATP-binding protein [Sabulibacter ruber]|uniref:heme ABC transporter ATP-binding protein n=1 Tax=Sabulibacter ruber TaxID=2811901 RepID=UPI001A960E68|nr:heme ABC transporter ATP-binding protein [Sabulibacter ruber]